LQRFHQLHDQRLEHRRVVGQQGGIGLRYPIRAHALFNAAGAKKVRRKHTISFTPLAFNPRVDNAAAASRWPGRSPTTPTTTPAGRGDRKAGIAERASDREAWIASDTP
jgi:hypothetical protein